MFDIDVPYDRTKLHISLPEECVAGVLEGHQSEFKAEGTQEQLIRIRRPRLRSSAKTSTTS